jgi:FkbM family methyltransferase
MDNGPRKLAFVLAASNQGTLIVSRLDFRMVGADAGYGVGFQILETGAFDEAEVALGARLLRLRRQHHGDGVTAVDGGANIGAHTVSWASAMTGWGSVIAVEAQERIFYALAGNLAINNCFNARALLGVIASQPGTMRVPVPDYLVASTFGSLELRDTGQPEFIGQPIDYVDGAAATLPAISIDALGLARVDLIKLDIEGMELEGLEGAANAIERSHPILIVETLKSDARAIHEWLDARGYARFAFGLNVLAVHASDPVLTHVRMTQAGVTVASTATD